MGTLQSVVVVGASLAGLRAAEALRRLGYEGRLALVGAEPHLPYDRPPLSKQLLAGRMAPDQILLRPADKYADLALDLHLGTRATGLDLAAREVHLEGAGGPPSLAFDGLVIATGGTPVRLPDTEGRSGVHVLRTLDDALALRGALERSPRVVVIGAGFIGGEVAATCRERGLEVAMVEALPFPLAQRLPRAMGELVGALHRDHGVELHCGASVEALEGEAGVEAVRLADGRRLPADVVVLGIGVRPAVGWLADSGLQLDDGVVCDETCLAAPGVVAAGDVARWHHRTLGAPVRIEHWTHAVEQAEAAASRLLAGEGPVAPFAPVPYFWSDQYDRKIQLAGRIGPDDEMRIVQGSLEERRFAALFGRAGKLTAVLAWNRPAAVVRNKRRIEEGMSLEEAVAAHG